MHIAKSRENGNSGRFRGIVDNQEVSDMWIEDYRTEHGMELDEFTRYVNSVKKTVKPRLYAHISDTLIHMLENDKNCITHPRIANILATACHATREQRDMIVAEQYKGMWEPDDTWEAVKHSSQDCRSGKAVVKIDRYGNVLDWFESVADAARREQHGEDIIRKRCRRRSNYDITTRIPYTYRFDSEWSKMTAAEKLNDIKIQK